MATQYAFGKIITDGLVLCLDAADRNSYVSGSTTWFDVAGSNNGTLTNGPTFNSGSGGNIVFDGTNDYVDCGNLTTLDNMSIQMFVRVLSRNNFYNGFAASKGASNDFDSGFIIQMAGTGASFNSFNVEGGFLRVGGGTEFMTSTVSFGTWANVCLTISPSYIQFYLNGSPQYGTTRLNNASTTIGMSNLVIGTRVYNIPSFSVNANIANTQIYNRALTTSEVLQNYNAQKSRFGL
jgi:hypothetical protein